MPAVWPRGIRKSQPYTAEELLGRDCLKDAKHILRANPGGQLVHITPPPDVVRVNGCLGEVYPPGGGEIGVGLPWYDHYVVRIGGRYYDCMTGPAGMTEDAYRGIFRHGGDLVFEVVNA